MGERIYLRYVQSVECIRIDNVLYMGQSQETTKDVKHEVQKTGVRSIWILFLNMLILKYPWEVKSRSPVCSQKKNRSKSQKRHLVRLKVNV